MLRCLISLVKWVFVNFPFTFPLLFAFFFFIHINSAIAADIVPADAQPAKVCDVWRAYASGIPNAGTYEGCSAQEAANAAYAAMMPVNHCAQYPRSYKGCEPRVMNSSYWGIWGQRCEVQGSTSCQVWNPPQFLDSNGLQNLPDTHTCPPDDYPEYTVGPLEKEDGTKWCAKPGDSCSGMAGVTLPDHNWFYASVVNCKSGCEIRANPAPGTGGVYFLWDYKGAQVYKEPGGGIYTGASCEVGAPDAGPEPSDSDPATDNNPETGQKDCELTYSSATGQSTCSASHEKSGDGYKCGEINGVWTCVQVPRTTGTQTDKTGQANGDGTATETTNQTVTDCAGDSCTTDSTTSTTTRPIGGAGPGGGTNGGGSGDGDGDGDGGCTGDKCAIPGEGEPASWWESSYPDGIEGVWSDFADNIQQTEFLQFVRQFEVDVGGGAPPDFNICFTALWDLGCHSIAPPDFVWSVMRLFMLITAAFTCRKLIFGG